MAQSKKVLEATPTRCEGNQSPSRAACPRWPVEHRNEVRPQECQGARGKELDVLAPADSALRSVAACPQGVEASFSRPCLCLARALCLRTYHGFLLVPGKGKTNALSVGTSYAATNSSTSQRPQLYVTFPGTPTKCYMTEHACHHVGVA